MDLLGYDSSSMPVSSERQGATYGLDGLSGLSLGGPTQPMGGLMEAAPQLQLHEQPDLDSERFQTLWMQLTDAGNIQKQIRSDVHLATNEIEAHLSKQKIFCMASGQIGNEFKFFFFSQSSDRSGYFMVECLMNQ